MRLKTFYVALIAATLAAVSANAGPVYLSLVVDPATTASAGIPSSGSFNLTSNRSGAGTWHLYVVDDTTGSFGINNFKVQLNGTVPLITNRSTQTQFEDENGEFQPAGFADPTVRSAANVNPISGGQPLGSPYRITGLGQATSNYAEKFPDAVSFSATTNGQWGNYATDPTGGPAGKSWLFLAEGTYTGAAPTIDLANSNVVVYTAADFSTSTFGTLEVFGGAANLPPVIADAADQGGVTAGDIVTTTFTATGPEDGQTVTFSNAVLSSAVLAFPGWPIPNPTFDGVVNPDGTFSWDTTGWRRGTYTIDVTATDNGTPAGVSVGGSFVVTVTQVPEPSTFALLGIAVAGMVGMARRRNG